MDRLSNASASIAIVGMACRFPGGATCPDEFWSFLAERGDGLTEIPAERWDINRYYNPDPNAPGTMYVRHASFIKQDPFRFDPEFFGISPREADHIDPQQRLLLEVGWEALEDAGLPRSVWRGSNTGVFVGGFMLDRQGIAMGGAGIQHLTAHSATGASMTVLSARLAYTFDLHGPTLTVDTACSSSLVATHLARRALLANECDAALVGGVNLMLSPATTVLMCKGRFLAADGRSKTFEAGGDGYGRGEGCGVVLLKRLDRALADGDRIYALIDASGVNQDGKTDGLPMPNSEAQESLIRRVCAEADIDLASVQLVEAHGTGTAVGDPLETRALGVTYGQAAGRTEPLRIASVKANIGHLEAAAGVAGLIKAALTVHRRTILPHRELKNPNPAIKLDEWRLRVPLEAETFPDGEPARVAINSFGYGGTNAHVVLREPPPARTEAAGGADIGMVPISAQSAKALRARARQIAGVAGSSAAADLAYTLVARRTHLRSRAVIAAKDNRDLVLTLSALADGEPHDAVVTGDAMTSDASLVFLFTGMGPQWWAMGRQLYTERPTFRRMLDQCDALFREHAKFSLLAEMNAEQSASKMRLNWVAQPANFFVQAGLVAMLRDDYGVTPAAYIGHSVGEIAAAWAAGCVSFEDAIYISYHRSQLQQQVAGRGTMLAVGIGADAVAPLVSADVAIAAINASDSVTLAGSKQALDVVAGRLTAQGTFNRFVGVEVAYHSQHMDPLQGAFLDRLARIEPRAPAAPLYSTVTGQRVEGAVHDAAYWWRNARQPVLLAATLNTAVSDGHNVFVEIGPHPVLGAAVKTTLRERNIEGRTTALMRREQPEVKTFVRGLSELHIAGVQLPWDAWTPKGALVSLPAYPWEGERHWFEPADGMARRIREPGAHPLLDVRVDAATSAWRTALRGELLTLMSDHRVGGDAIFPGAAYIESALAAARLITTAETVAIEDVRFMVPLVIAADGSSEIEVDFTPARRAVAVASRRLDTEWTTNATARLGDAMLYPAKPTESLATIAKRCTRVVDVPALYATLAARGLSYGPAFQTVDRVSRGHDEALAHVSTAQTSAFAAHPALVDGALQTLVTLVDGSSDAATYLPVGCERVVQWRTLGRSAHVHARLARVDAKELVGDIAIYDEAGELAMELRQVRCQATATDRQATSNESCLGIWWPERPVTHTDARGEWVVIGSRSDRHIAGLIDTLKARGADSVAVLAHDEPLPQDMDHLVYCVDGRDAPPGDAKLTKAFIDTVVRALAVKIRKRVTLVTWNARWELPNPADLSASAVLGAATVVQNEHPELYLRPVDLDAGEHTAADLNAWVDAITATDDNEEVAVRNGVRYARRLRNIPMLNAERRAQRREVDSTEQHVELAPYSATLSTRTELTFVAAERPTAKPGQVVIRTELVTINFKDFAKWRGILTGAMVEGTFFGTSIGFEGVGRVVEVGEGVTRTRLGERVWFLAQRALQSYAIAVEGAVIPLGDSQALEACSLPVLTVVYGLETLANLRRNERVLIHSATGGVGLAAIQYARHVGAEIYATAGSEEKRQVLRDMGIAHVYDSRTLAFADEIQRDTGGTGVDVVLNSLVGPALVKSLGLLADGGRFVELGKHDMFADTSLGMRVFERSASFLAVDLERLLAPLIDGRSVRAPIMPRVIARMRELCERGVFQAAPTQVFPASAINEAMARFGQRQHTGRIALDMRGRVAVATGVTPRAALGNSGTWLVSGGTSGMGLHTAGWLVERGVRSIILAGRRGTVSPDDAAALESMRARGATVHVRALDVGDAKAVIACIGDVQRTMPKLTGIIHSAMVLKDELVTQMTAEGMDAVMRAKALGAWNLHEATATLGLEHFIVFSSGSTFLGLKGQGAYCAANLFIESLVHYRRRSGLPAMAIAWGALGGVGVVARSDATVGEHLRRNGFLQMPAQRATELMGAAMDEDHALIGLANFDFERWMTANPGPSWRRLELLRTKAATADLKSLVAELATLPVEERVPTIARRIRDIGAQLLKLPPERVDIDTPLRDLGLDSLLAVEFQQTLARDTGIRTSAPDLISGVSARGLAARVLKLAGMEESSAPAPQVTARADAPREGEALRAWALQHICAQPPYFALTDMKRAGEWVTASALADMRMPHEYASVPIADASRHGTILGSVAARIADPRPGRVFYPLHKATLMALPDADPTALSAIAVRARCVSVDPIAQKAHSEIEIVGPRDEVLMRISAEYYAMMDKDFYASLAAHRRPTSALPSPYGVASRFVVEHLGDSAIVARLPQVTPEMCAGHFDDLPAYPIAVLLRDLVSLWPHVARVQTSEMVRMRPLSAQITAHRFIFTGETPTLEAKLVQHQGASQRWAVNASADGHAVADVSLELERAR